MSNKNTDKFKKAAANNPEIIFTESAAELKKALSHLAAYLDIESNKMDKVSVNRHKTGVLRLLEKMGVDRVQVEKPDKALSFLTDAELRKRAKTSATIVGKLIHDKKSSDKPEVYAKIISPAAKLVGALTHLAEYAPAPAPKTMLRR